MNRENTFVMLFIIFLSHVNSIYSGVTRKTHRTVFSQYFHEI